MCVLFLASYIGYNLVLAVLSVIISIIVSNCHHRDVKRAAVPPIVRLVSCGFLMSSPPHVMGPLSDDDVRLSVRPSVCLSVCLSSFSTCLPV